MDKRKKLKMNKIAMIIPYIGKFPNYFDTTLCTCSKNKSIDWYIFTDQSIEKYDEMYENVIFYKTTLESIKQKIEAVSGRQNIKCDTPYKLCDYKPLYGEIFSDYVADYDYWGYCDLDTVFGDLDKFLKLPLEKEYDKIGNWGHFTLIKNTPEVNHRYTLSVKEDGQPLNLFDEMVKTNKVVHFDETAGINRIYQENDFKVIIDQDLCGDILYENLDLYSNDKRFVKADKMCFLWNDGKAYLIYKKDGQIGFNEFGYIHLQKRKAFKNFIMNMVDVNSFVITTLGYHKINDISKETLEFWMNQNHSTFYKRLKYLYNWYFKTDQFTSKKIGNIYVPISYIKWRILNQKNFRI